MLNNLNQKAFTLVEMLVALAVSSIMIMATYASYDIVAQQFKKNKDIAELHTSGRAILRMVERDIRMAGFSFRDRDANLVFGEILDKDALKLTDSGTDACCDSITVQYDYYDEEYKTVERQEIIYDSSKYKDRNRLYKRINILGKDGELYTTKKIGKREVMADFIEDLQFVNIEGGSLLWHGDRFNQNLSAAVIEKIPGKAGGGMGDNWRRVKSISINSDGVLYTGCNYPSGSEPRGIHMIDVKTDKGKHIFKGRLRGIDMANATTFAPDGTLYSVYNSRLSAFYSDSSISYIGLPFNATAIASDDNGLLYMGSNSSKNIQIYNPKTKRTIGSIPTKTMSSRVIRVNDITINGDRLFVASADHYSVQIYSIKSRKNIGYIPTSYIKNAIVVGGPHNLLYSGSESRREIEVHNPNTAERLGRIRTGDPISDLAISDNKSGQEALVKIHLVIRSRKEHSRIDKTYTKKSYDIGNYKLNKRDKYKHDSFSSTVLVRNMVL
jgi:prepilin-type N-terminal cleavage/methylation domain-containing protein